MALISRHKQSELDSQSDASDTPPQQRAQSEQSERSQDEGHVFDHHWLGHSMACMAIGLQSQRSSISHSFNQTDTLIQREKTKIHSKRKGGIYIAFPSLSVRYPCDFQLTFASKERLLGRTDSLMARCQGMCTEYENFRLRSSQSKDWR